MAQLSNDPKDWELEDLVAAHFVSRGCFVESGITEEGVLELDVVWTDYREERPQPRPVEVKSGDWGMGDIFKFYGWTRYLVLPPGQFVYKHPPRGSDRLFRINETCRRMGIDLLSVSSPEDVSEAFAALELGEPAAPHLPDVWRYSYWVRRRLLSVLSVAEKNGVCPESARRAKEYRQLVNDVLFFEPDPRERYGRLLNAHLRHPYLSTAAALEMEGRTPVFDRPVRNNAFQAALFRGKHRPIQACLYQGHRARLYVLKAAVDYWLARERGELKPFVLRIGDEEFDLGDAPLHANFRASVEHYAEEPWFPLLPVFWQIFLWGWGGFILHDREEEEYARLADQTGVPAEDIPDALKAFDRFFNDEWFVDEKNAQRRVIKLMPPAVRGVGAYEHRRAYGHKKYASFGYTDYTEKDLRREESTAAQLLEARKRELAD